MLFIPGFDPINIAILTVAIFHLVIGIVVLVRGEQRRANIFFACLELSLTVWSVCMIYYRSVPPDTIETWAKALYVAALFIPFSFLYFVYSFPEDRFIRFPLAWRFASFAPVVFLVWTSATGRLMTSVVRADPG